MSEKKTDKTDSNIRSQMRKGILEYCVLLLINRQRAYPSDIIYGLSDADLIVVEGTLYTLLNRLRKEGKLSYEWEESPKGPPRKYYFITETGKAALDEMSAAWDEIVANVNHFRNLSAHSSQIEDATNITATNKGRVSIKMNTATSSENDSFQNDDDSLPDDCITIKEDNVTPREKNVSFQNKKEI